ncbi:response regulator transcription factor [Paraburkholderia strydomiana]|uniref:response regulator transcription factor n=1 Tax=Paraburkholderia strydomiana TaxID=1245417 RepID=UPI001BEA9070|nr:response regulator [Paraburkholderia strydomiana]MBT2793623.1 response regulator [Paraburkholderia strydomiana]
MYSILLVDDEPDLPAVWHLILSGEGYDVRCAGNGAEGLDCVRQRVPDLAITDWTMAGPNCVAVDSLPRAPRRLTMPRRSVKVPAEPRTLL